MTRRRIQTLFGWPAALAVVGTLGCTGDDTTPGPNPDAAAQDGATVSDATATPDAAADSAKPDAQGADSGLDGLADSGQPDAQTADSAQPDARGADSAVDGAADGTTEDAASDAKADAARDAAPLGDGSAVDAAPDATGGGRPQPLALCALMDSKFLLNETNADAAAAEGDRTNAWAGYIYLNFSAQTGGYIGRDCSFSGFLDALNGLPDMGSSYSAFMPAWIQQFLGCPIVDGDGGALTYGIIPDGLSAHVFSSGDLNKLSSDFVDAINNTLECAGDCINGAETLPDGGTLANVARLTDAQVASIRAQLAYVQSQVKPAPVNSTAFSFTPDSMCDPNMSCIALCSAPDAGASDASGD